MTQLDTHAEVVYIRVVERIMRRSDRNFTKIPDGKLGIIALEGCKELGKTIDNYIIQWRSETYKDFKDSVACDGYLRDTYLLDASCPRFGSGEAKGIIRESVRDTTA